MVPRGIGAAVHPFINFAALAKNKGPTIAISDNNSSVVDLFTAAGTQVGQLAGFSSPVGLASDVKGDLYVADQFNSRVAIYAAGFASPPATLSDPGEYPTGVDSFANGAYVAVANTETTSNGPGSVSIFKGSTLLRTITSPLILFLTFCAFDGKGNLYVDGASAIDGGNLLAEIPHATSGGSTFVQLTTTNAINTATGIQVTTAGQIAIEDGINDAIYTYNPPSGGSLGTPTQITPLGGSVFPLTFAFTKNMTDLYVADPKSAAAFEYAYPSGGAAVSSFNVGGVVGYPYGTTVIPTQYPSGSR
jgi:hypothetical protein